MAAGDLKNAALGLVNHAAVMKAAPASGGGGPASAPPPEPDSGQ